MHLKWKGLPEHWPQCCWERRSNWISRHVLIRVVTRLSKLPNPMLCSKELVARSHLILRGRRLIALSSRWGQEITIPNLARAGISFF